MFKMPTFALIKRLKNIQHRYKIYKGQKVDCAFSDLLT